MLSVIQKCLISLFIGCSLQLLLNKIFSNINKFKFQNSRNQFPEICVCKQLMQICLPQFQLYTNHFILLFTLRKNYILKYWSLGCKQIFVFHLKAGFKLKFSLNYVKVAKSLVFCCFLQLQYLYINNINDKCTGIFTNWKNQVRAEFLLNKKWSVKCEAILQFPKFSRIMKPAHS